MPNHVHGIIQIQAHDGGDTTPSGTQAQSLGSLIQTFKSISSRRIHRACPDLERPLWHRNYHERIIRDQASLERIRRYIKANPARWRG
jgi:REP element-mobilizing transposase RayT